MSERATPAGELFRWRPAGVGRRAVPCARCEERTPVRLLENLLEALCASCGRSLAIERARALERELGGPAALSRLVAAGALDAADAAPGPGGVGPTVEELVERGALRRDLRLTVDLDVAGKTFAYDAAPLKALALPEEVERALERRRVEGGALPEPLGELVRERLAASIRSVGLEVGLEGLLDGGDIDPACRRALPARALDVYRAVPVRRAEGALVVALWDPLDDALVSDLEALVEGPVHAILARPEALRAALETLGSPGTARYRPVSDVEADVEEADGEAEDDELSLELTDDPAADLLLEALEEGATEVLLEPRAGTASVRLRIGGELRKERAVQAGLPAALAERLDALAGRGAGGVTTGRARTGHARWEVSGLPVALDYRVVTTSLGPAVAIALEGEAFGPPPGLSALGLSLDALAAFEALLAEGRGLFVIAAPRRGGKTTAYEAVLERARRLGGAVMSLERRGRRALAGVTQVELDGDDPLDLEALRHPPPDWLGVDDGLEVGARLAIDVALGGGAAVVTVTAPDAGSALTRLELAGIPRGLLAGHVRAVVARRVVPRNCPRCRFALPGAGPGEAESSWIGIGCPACGDTGTAGVVTLAELARPRLEGLAQLGGSAPLAVRARDLLATGEVSRAAVADLVVHAT